MSDEKLRRQLEAAEDALDKIAIARTEIQNKISATNKKLMQNRRDRHDKTLEKIVGKYLLVNNGSTYLKVLSRKKRNGHYTYMCTSLRYGHNNSKNKYFYELIVNAEYQNFYNYKIITENRFNKEWNKFAELAM